MNPNLLKKVMFVSLSLLVIACSKEENNKLVSDTANSVILLDDASSEPMQSAAIVSGATIVYSNATRNANSNQTDDDLIRGTRVTIPLFEPNPIDIRVGQWATIAFSLQRAFDSETCGEPLTEAQINEVLNIAQATITELEIAGTFNGESIEVMSNFRTDGLTTVESGGNCIFNLPWRFYVNPQPAGEYSLTFSFTGGTFERTVNWVKP